MQLIFCKGNAKNQNFQIFDEKILDNRSNFIILWFQSVPPVSARVVEMVEMVET